MNKISKVTKYLNAILSGIFIVSFFFRFCSYSLYVDTAYASSESSVDISGWQVISNGGIWGIIIIICLVAILASTYISKLKKFKNIVCTISSALLLLSVFLVVSVVTASSSGIGSDGSFDISTTRSIGFWIMLIDSILLLALSIINLLNLKGNAAFDALNENNDSETIDSVNFAEQVTGIKEKVSSVTQNISSATSSSNKKKNSDSIMENINKLNEMKENGVITQEEYDEKKKQFLDKM